MIQAFMWTLHLSLKARRMIVGIVGCAGIISCLDVRISAGNSLPGAAGAATPTSAQVKLITTTLTHEKRLIALAWRPDGKVLATLGADHQVKLCDAYGQQLGKTFEVESGSRDLSWSPDGEKLAVIANRTVEVFRVDGSLKSRLVGHLGRITSLSWSADSRTILTSSEDRTSNLWDAANGRIELSLLPGGPQRKQTDSVLRAIFTKDILFDSDAIATQAAFGRNDRTILTASTFAFSKKFPKLWDAASGRLIATLQPPGQTSGPTLFVIYSPDRRLIATGGFDGVYLWNSLTGDLILDLSEPNGTVAFSPDGKQILANSHHQRAGIWDVTTGTVVRLFDSATDSFFGAGWSGDGLTIFTSVRHSKASIWDAMSGRLKTTVPLVKNRGWVVDFQDDLSLSDKGGVLFAVTDKYVRFWDATTGQLISELPSLKKGRRLPFGLSADRKFVAAADGKTGKLWLWEVVE